MDRMLKKFKPMNKMLFAPGPINVPEKLRQMAANYEPPYFASREFSILMKEIQVNLRILFNTAYPVLIGTGSGSMGMEMCVTNFFAPGDTVIIVNTGKYGANWVKMARTYGLKVIEFLAADGDIVEPQLIRNFLDAQQDFNGTSHIKGFLMTHVETTTGVLNPVDDYHRISNEYMPHCITIVDAISSFLSEIVNGRDYDVVISASQKGLALPAGLFFMMVSNKAAKMAEGYTLPNFYFDVIDEIKRQGKHTTKFTPASYIFPMLHETLKKLVLDGVQNIINYAEYISELTKDIILTNPHITTFTGYPSTSVSIFQCDKATELIYYLNREHDIVIGGGLRKLSGKVIRIRNFGYHTPIEDFKKVALLISRWRPKYDD